MEVEFCDGVGALEDLVGGDVVVRPEVFVEVDDAVETRGFEAAATRTSVKRAG